MNPKTLETQGLPNQSQPAMGAPSRFQVASDTISDASSRPRISNQQPIKVGGTTASDLWGGHSPTPQPAATHTGQADDEINEPEQQSEPDDLPKTYAGLLAEHLRLTRILNHPLRNKNFTRSQLKQLAVRHQAVKKKLGEIQQGELPPVITATHMVPIQKSQTESLRRQRWEMIARMDMYVADLLKEHDLYESFFLKHKDYITEKEIAELQAETNEQSTTIAELTSKSAALDEEKANLEADAGSW